MTKKYEISKIDLTKKYEIKNSILSMKNYDHKTSHAKIKQMRT